MLRTLFAGRFDISDEDSSQSAADKLVQGFLEVLGPSGEVHAHVVGLQLGYGFEDSSLLEGIAGDPVLVEERAHRALDCFFRELGQAGPSGKGGGKAKRKGRSGKAKRR